MIELIRSAGALYQRPGYDHALGIAADLEAGRTPACGIVAVCTNN